MTVPLALSAGVAGCDREVVPPAVPPGPPEQVVALSPRAAQGSAGAALATPLAVRVVDGAGRGVPNVSVRWLIERGDGGRLAPAEAVTDALGETRTTWTLGPRVETQSVAAMATTVSGPVAVRFTAQAAAGAPATVRLAVEARAVAVGDSVHVTAAVSDAFGNATDGRGVTLLAADTTVLRVEPPSALRGRRPGTTLVSARLAAGGSAASDSVSVRVYAPLRASDVGSGGSFSCALTADSATGVVGRAHCWGADPAIPSAAQLPPDFLVGPLAFRTLTVSALHACALTGAGEAWCWGNNSSGQLGDGTLVSSSTAVRVAGDHRFVRVAAGAGFTCGIDLSARVLCWGANEAGQLGTGAPSPARRVPTAVAAIASPTSGGTAPPDVPLTAFAIATGGRHACALASETQRPAGETRAGVAYCWGARGAWLGLGGASGTDLTVPAPRAVGGGRRFTRISAGLQRTCAIDTAARVYCWGVTADTTWSLPGSDTPARAFEDRAYTDVSAGWLTTCAIADDATAFCDGSDRYRERGAGSAAPDLRRPTRVVGSGFTAISVGRDPGAGTHVCGIAAGVARCWGWNWQGRTGLSGIEGPNESCGFRDRCAPRPTAVPAMGSRAGDR